MRHAASAAVIAALLLTGCATKRYGRLQPLTGAERVAYTCRDIDLEIAKVGAFQQQVIEGAQFNVASVLGILGDYGIGNSMERGSAEASAARRLGQLTDLKAERGCSGTSLTAVDQRAAVVSVSNAPRAAMSTDPAFPRHDRPWQRGQDGAFKQPFRLVHQGASGYIGSGSVNRPSVTAARPICS